MSDPDRPQRLRIEPRSAGTSKQFRLVQQERHDLVRALITRITVVQQDRDTCDRDNELYRLRNLLDRFSD